MREFVLRLAAGAVFAIAAAAPIPAEAATTARYWNFADSRAAELDSIWSDKDSAFRDVPNRLPTRLNATMLKIYALAAEAGHAGAARNDSRARALVNTLTTAPAFVTKGVTGPIQHLPAWTDAAEGAGTTHMAIDPTIAESLAAAWENREQLGLTSAQVARIVDCIKRVAATSLFSKPINTLNQWNWPASIWTSRAIVTGDWREARVRYRAAIKRFIDGAPTRGTATAGNLNDGLGFNYSPGKSLRMAPNTLSSTEYGNIAFSGLRSYSAMLDHGMQPLDAKDVDLLANWSKRMLMGEWTHSGYPNWDTGLGMLRWNLVRYWAWAESGLMAHFALPTEIAQSNERSWTVDLLDRGLELFERTDSQDIGLMPSYMWDVPGTFALSGERDGYLVAARFGALAAQAAVDGFGDVEPIKPGPWFAFDPTSRRIAISTPAYSTAFAAPQTLTDTHYGGLEPTRLLDSLGRPLSGIGRYGPMAFNLRVSNGVHPAYSSQSSDSRAPLATGWTVKADGEPSLRGAFQELAVTAKYSGPEASLSIRHTFTPNGFTTTRKVTTKRNDVVSITLPIWGNAALPAELLTSDAEAVPLADAPVAISQGSATFRLNAENGGSYTATLSGIPSDARAWLIGFKAASSSPSTSQAVEVRFTTKARAPVTVTQVLSPLQNP